MIKEKKKSKLLNELYKQQKLNKIKIEKLHEKLEKLQDIGTITSESCGFFPSIPHFTEPPQDKPKEEPKDEPKKVDIGSLKNK